MSSRVNNVPTRVGFTKIDREWLEQYFELAVSGEPCARAAVATVVVTAVVGAVAVVPSSLAEMMIAIVVSAAALTNVFETSKLGGVGNGCHCFTEAMWAFADLRCW